MRTRLVLSFLCYRFLYSTFSLLYQYKLGRSPADRLKKRFCLIASVFFWTSYATIVSETSKKARKNQVGFWTQVGHCFRAASTYTTRIRVFVECFLSGTRQRTSLPSAERKTLGRKKHSAKRLLCRVSKKHSAKTFFTECFFTLGKKASLPSVNFGTRQRLSLPSVKNNTRQRKFQIEF